MILKDKVKAIEEAESYYQKYPDKLNDSIANQLVILVKLKDKLLEFDSEIRLQRL